MWLADGGLAELKIWRFPNLEKSLQIFFSISFGIISDSEDYDSRIWNLYILIFWLYLY